MDDRESGERSRLLIANVYSVGFIIAILGRTDVFTEYTTITILPVLTGHSRLRSLVRLWTLVYVGILFAGLIRQRVRMTHRGEPSAP